MPKKVKYNVRDQAYAALVEQLQSIRVASGYNTNPTVTGKPEKTPERGGDPLIYVVPGPDAIPLTNVSMIADVDSTFFISGSVYVDPEMDDPLLFSPLNALIQDVRTAISTGWEQMNAKIVLEDEGDSVPIMWLLGGMSTDEGALAESGEAQFTQTIVAKYMNGTEW